MFYDWKPYVSTAQRKLAARRAAEKLARKGRALSPVAIRGTTIARTFWGKAWCDNLERYSDFANRLPRGRSYLRNGSVLSLEIEPGRVEALVSGTQIYRVEVKVAPVPARRWAAICRESAGAIDSLVELLRGRFSKAVMERLCRERTGLFPAPEEIELSCSCPDWATMCKHVAAVLYGVGARLDEQPQLLFRLRQVDEKDLIARAGEGLGDAVAQRPPGRVLRDENLAELFGLDMGAAPEAEQPKLAPKRGRARSGQAVASKAAAGKVGAGKPRGKAAGEAAAKRRGKVRSGKAALAKGRREAAPRRDRRQRRRPGRQ